MAELMGDDTQNPYQAPSLAVSEEGAVPPSRFNARERRAIEQFVWANQIVAVCLIALGVILLSALLISTASGIGELPILSLIQFSVTMLAMVGLGVLQERRSVVAITISGALALALAVALVLAVIALVIQAVVAGGTRFAALFAALPCVGLFSVIALFPPIWLAIQAWHWRLCGVDLQDLSKVKYHDLGKPNDLHFGERVDQDRA